MRPAVSIGTSLLQAVRVYTREHVAGAGPACMFCYSQYSMDYEAGFKNTMSMIMSSNAERVSKSVLTCSGPCCSKRGAFCRP